MAVVVAVPGMGMDFHMAMPFVAMLCTRFGFDCYVPNIVLAKFLPDQVLNFRTLAVGNDVQSSEVILSVHTPNVDMMHIKYAVNFFDMFYNFRCFNIMGRLFQEQIEDLF